MSSPVWLYLLSAVGGYGAMSLYLLKNPQILHKKRRRVPHCRHISHRGGAGERIENTIEAFRNAVDQKTDLLEIDCHLTKDRQVVVSHDENLLRQTGQDSNISDLNYLELPRYKERLEVLFSPGSYSTGTDVQIPLLEEVFQRFPDVPINIEIKEDNEVLIKKVAALVKKYQRDHITIWASANDHIMDKCRVENPEMPFIFTVKRGIILLALFYSGLLPFVSLPESFVETIMPSIYNRTYISESKVLQNKFVSTLFGWLTMRKSLFQHLEARGIQVILWVLNQDSDFQKAFEYGATGVMTDYPTKLRRFLDSHPSYARS
ncbi:lysophospholipase D GDPD3a [Latimeria chalumnae]|uniref:lysophospholipase D GDPD3a n=1 Tax=Latimeria chalumnae TaxID=7897 RepID=UPI0003C14FBA|nr:PREDICTED: glycerophosphodiester phosphodiesterase domain-containing protein 1-like [Latimeria chalumnae]|eukprot:XP_006012940.1 PREDICTED: glycerophosphodiester phosphodiesterase domain-containing protein 1-like [Latimeria chalumnae]